MLSSLIRFSNSLIQDVRHSVRFIRRSKGLALGVVISMGLGLGATASLFSLADFFAFRPLRVPETDRVVRIANSTATHPVESLSYPEYQDYVDRSGSFIGIATYETPIVGFAANPADQPRATVGMPVSGNFFSVLQVKPVIGRGFLPDEDSVPGRDAVAVISHQVWQQDFGSSPDVVGRKVAINGHVFSIVGVAPEGFRGVESFIEVSVYFPRMMIQQVLESSADTSPLTNRSIRPVRILARLKPGTTIDQAKDDVAQISNQLAAGHPETNKDTRGVVLTQYGFRMANDPRLLRTATALLVIASLILAIACINVSNLLLSTVPERTRETAVRLAIGAPRARLLRQLLIESAILAGGGALLGLLIASWGAAYLSSIRLGTEFMQTQVDERVVIFTVAAGLVAALISGAIPAWRCSRNDLNSLLKSSDARNRPQKTWGRQILVGGQVAAASVMLVFSGYLLKDLRIAATRTPGFRVDHILTMYLNPSIAGYDVEKTRAFYSALIERMRSVPGVKSAAIAQEKPFGVMNNGSTSLAIEGYELPENRQSIDIRSAFVGNGYFETLDIPIIRGRAFDRRDSVNAPKTVIINETMAKEYWRNRDPIGARVDINEDGSGPAEVIGIARDSKYGSMNEHPMAFLYRSYDQGDETMAALFLETESDPAALTSAVRTELRNIGPNMPIFEIRTMQNHFRENGLFELRLSAQLLTVLGLVALALGVLGLYGVIAYSVSQRSYEIGIRMAVGATDRQVMRMVLLQGLRSSGIAAVLGLVFAMSLKGIATAMVSYVDPGDPVIYGGVLLLMLIVTGAACYIPARRASMVDPNVTLRS